MSQEKELEEPFLTRWSRLKQESAAAPPAPPAPKPAAGPAPELPPLESLSLESDFTGFLHPKVEERLKREALKKLFGDPHFNRMDGLDVYIGDYNLPDPLPEGMLEKLTQYRTLQDQLRATEEERAARERGTPLPEPERHVALPQEQSCGPAADGAQAPGPAGEAEAPPAKGS